MALERAERPAFVPSPALAGPGVKAWAADLFAGAGFPDRRLARRARTIAAAFAARPADSIPQAFDDWAGTKGAYRFIENRRVTCQAIETSVAQAAARACLAYDSVLAVQDTTGATFPNAARMEGLGSLNDGPTLGLMLHSTLALRPDGTPLGLLNLQWWARDPAEKGKAAARRSRPLEQKESAKWLQGIRAARRAMASQNASSRLIHLGDREEDVHEVFQEIDATGEGAVIRCAQNRRVADARGRAGLAHDAVRKSRLLGAVRIDLPRSHGRPARDAVGVQMRACRLRLEPPAHRRRRPVEITLVEAWEKHAAPEGLEPLHWLLWTTETVESLEDALAIVEIYKLRWRIEDYHLVLKAGCRVEELQFESAERAAKAIYLYAPAAVRIVALRDLARRQPDAPCTQVLSGAEWRALWTRIHKEAPSRATPPPSLRQAVLWIGRMGGHLGRRGDGMPGVRALWRGWRDLQALAVLYAILAP